MMPFTQKTPTIQWTPMFYKKKKKWMIPSIRLWGRLKINGRQDGQQQFCKVIIKWQIHSGQLRIDMRFDRRMDFAVTKKGQARVDLYDKRNGGAVVLVVTPSFNKVRKDDTVVIL